MMPAAASCRNREEAITNVDARNRTLMVEVFKRAIGSLEDIYMVGKPEGLDGVGTFISGYYRPQGS